MNIKFTAVGLEMSVMDISKNSAFVSELVPIQYEKPNMLGKAIYGVNLQDLYLFLRSTNKNQVIKILIDEYDDAPLRISVIQDHFTLKTFTASNVILPVISISIPFHFTETTVNLSTATVRNIITTLRPFATSVRIRVDQERLVFTSKNIQSDNFSFIVCKEIDSNFFVQSDEGKVLKDFEYSLEHFDKLMKKNFSNLLSMHFLADGTFIIIQRWENNFIALMIAPIQIN